MVLDYSKWDALELSDDSDIEVHPNVDKRSFIRAKQNQIHQERAQRRHEIETLKYERIINDGLLRRIDTLLSEIRTHESEAKDENTFIYQALISSAGDAGDDEPPKPPDGVHTQTSQPRYSQMMASLVDQVKKEVGDSQSRDWYKGYVTGIEGHKKKVLALQKELLLKLDSFEKEEKRRITSESIHTGFDSSFVAKGSVSNLKNNGHDKIKSKAVEVLNPGPKSLNTPHPDSAADSGAEADVDENGSVLKQTAADAEEKDEADVKEASPLAKRFAQIRPGDYRACLQFISENRDIVAESATDGLLVEAFNSQMEKKSEYAKHCVHQALLLQYCRSLGRDGVGLFFKRITTSNHQAQKVFYDDVNATYQRIRIRTTELLAERAKESSLEGTEQIQLHAVEPGTDIHINVPQAGSADEVEVAAREIFERFPPGLQRALETGVLDNVNEILGKMSIEEAEEVVNQLGEGGMLSMERGIIDGTTEEGKQRIHDLGDSSEHADGPESVQ
ncbi:hsp90 co-chaperone Cdc37 [Agyrium rufum]|nr:hsp90 co-chaperone Cdc37 [Agyrium rufum]